jgi:predicted ribosomally synthesized peptide with nif11-like leader
MSVKDAEAFMERAESDRDFAAEIEALGMDQDAVVAKIREAGYDVTPEEMKEAFLDRYGAELTPEQLDAVAAGLSSEAEIGIGVAGGVVAAGIIGGALVAAVF